MKIKIQIVDIGNRNGDIATVEIPNVSEIYSIIPVESMIHKTELNVKKVNKVAIAYVECVEDNE